MNSREKIKDAYEKLYCFDNPLLKEIAEDLQKSYRDIFGAGIEEIIKDVALQQDVRASEIKNGGRNAHLVYCRYLVARQAAEDYTLVEIAKALNRSDHSTIVHLLRHYTPPQKYT